MIYFIVNETAKTGKGLNIWAKVKSILEEKHISYHAVKTKYKNHATELARQISNRVKETGKEITLIVLGGDGTLNEVVNGIEDFGKVRIGLIPTGSGNDFARGVGQKTSVEKSIDRVLNSQEEELLDIGKVTYEGGDKPRYFAISSGIGMDAEVCKKAFTSKLKKILNKFHLGKLTYLLITLQTLFSMKTEEIEVSFDEEEPNTYKRLVFTAAMNLRAEGGGVPMAPDADPADGKLSMCMAHSLSRLTSVFVLPFLVMAKHGIFPCVKLVDFEACQLKLEEPMTLHADGEYLGEVSWAKYECIPAVLRLIK